MVYTTTTTKVKNMWIKKQLKKEKKETFNSTVLCVLNVCWFPSGSFQWKDSHLLKFIN